MAGLAAPPVAPVLLPLTFTSNFVGAMFTAFQLGNESVAFAMPLAACSGTRTGPWNWAPQQRWLSSYFATIGLPPGSRFGNSTSTTGCTSLGTLPSVQQLISTCGSWPNGDFTLL